LDLFEEELVNLFGAFQSTNLAYIMVGGFATNLHGFNRFTADLDIWIKDTPENKHNFRKAIALAGYGDFPQYETMEFVPGWTTFALNNGMELDIMTFMANYTQANFDECYELAPMMDILGNQVHVLHLNHLIAEKAKLGRPKDLIDLVELEKIRSHKK
jgi:hypothetical protein